MKRVVVTGGSGQISYALLFQIANGLLFENEPVALHIRDIPEAMPALEAVAMELEDCAFPLLEEIHIGTNPFQLFLNADCAFLIGSKRRTKEMQRKDLLSENGSIFIEEGRALNEVASKKVKVLVVGNPCNTNCLIAMHHAPSLAKSQFHAMTRLDHHRAAAMLAKKAGVKVAEVSDLFIWGNHSSTLVPDFTNAKIRGIPCLEAIKDRHWLENDFSTNLQLRGAKIIEARGKSSAASASHSALFAMKSLFNPNHLYSSAMISDGNPYGIEEGLIFGFPCTTRANGENIIVSDFILDDFIKNKIRLTEKELLEERECVKHLLHP